MSGSGAYRTIDRLLKTALPLWVAFGAQVEPEAKTADRQGDEGRPEQYRAGSQEIVCLR